MSMGTAHWTTAPSRTGEPEAEGLRERKKRLMRQRLTDVATEMFLERGFDAVRVAEVAEACGVSEKTVFNYFPTKESLLLDRFDSTMVTLRTALAEPAAPPVAAALRILDAELAAITSWLAAQDDPVTAMARTLSFGDLIRSTPSLRAHHYEMTDRLIAMAAQVLATRAGLGPHDPRPQIAATALLGLWRVQSQSLRRHLDSTLTPARLHAAVAADVERAARLIDTGLRSFAHVPAEASRATSGQ